MRWYSVSADPLHVGSATVTPFARVLSIGGSRGGFAWQFPTHVRIERADRVEVLPIVDISRIAIYALYALAAVLFIRLWRGA